MRSYCNASSHATKDTLLLLRLQLLTYAQCTSVHAKYCLHILRHTVVGLDFLSSPSGVILEAQQLAAEAFGADHTWFLVNGCSAGIHAAVIAVTAEALAAAAGSADEVAVGTINKSSSPSSNSSREGGCCENMGSHLGDGGGGGTSCSRATLVLARNCHLSAFSALVIAGGCICGWSRKGG